jgi:hypothetical protein
MRSRKVGLIGKHIADTIVAQDDMELVSVADIVTAWPTIYALARQTFPSSLHFAFATVNTDGTPHVTPIGSLMLCPDEPKGIYFEIFTTQMPRNLATQQRVCVLAVRSGQWFWLLSLLQGRFATPPAVRLLGTVGPRREASTVELARWQRRVSRLRWLKGSRILWGQMRFVREITFDSYEPVRLGAMTRGLWEHE